MNAQHRQGWSMGARFGDVLRRLRGEASVRAFARRGHISPSYVTMLEKGTANPSLKTAVSLDHALGAHGELVEAFVADAPGARNAAVGAPTDQMGFVPTLDMAGMHAADDGEDATKRRALFGLAAGAASVLGFDEIVRQGLDLTTTPDRSAEDWDIARADHLHALRTRPPAQVVRDLSIDLYVLRQQMEIARGEELTELHRVAAMLASIQANALTRMSEHGSAIRWWSTAKKTADASRDLELSLLVRGEEAIHGLYGQREPETVLRLIEHARRLTRRPWPRLMTAQAKALALLNRPAEATATLHALHDHMHRGVVADRWDFFKPDQIPFAESWVAAYAGDEAAADAARDKVLSIIPEGSYQYRVNARLHEAISTAALGGVDEGARIAAGVIDSLPAEFRTNHVRETGRMVLRAVPLGEQARPAVADLRSMLAIEGR
ncbi:helix-turn-helix domain-containing protein [Nonomuraea sp. NPDC051191]|uniref:helix-turn-helix domain-containing protein n=1 Tax=Nonomuraea sp. NPDC051191 TaxID=3364372 RepID=UPI0037BD2664